jgi:hypothetical protein
MALNPIAAAAAQNWAGSISYSASKTAFPATTKGR